jgi:hypothetical protein
MKRSTCLFSVIIIVLVIAGSGLALDRGAILYHTSEEGKMYGLTALELPCSLVDVLLQEVGSGHVALYIGNKRIIHAVSRGVVEDASSNFITGDELSRGFRYVGAKIPVNYDTWTEIEKDQLILKAREQVGASYDFQFRHQKGPYDDGFTCVGLVEYVYEQVGYDITPFEYYPGVGTGRSENQTYNCAETLWQDDTRQNSFANDVEFSQIEHPSADTLNIGMIHGGERYIFFPYTQYLQSTTETTVTDVPVSGGEGSDDDNWWECFVATAAYGSSLHPHINVFREVRDRYLRESSVGRLFLTAYYRYSPPVARFIADHSALRIAVRIGLVPLLGISYMTVTFGPGMTGAMLTLLVILPLVFVYRHQKKRIDQ